MQQSNGFLQGMEMIRSKDTMSLLVFWTIAIVLLKMALLQI